MDDRKTIARRSTHAFEPEDSTASYAEKMAVIDTVASRKRTVALDESHYSERDFNKHSRSSSSSTISVSSAEAIKDVRSTLDSMYLGADRVRQQPSQSQKRNYINDGNRRDELNFGIVVPELFRSACPEPEDHMYLKSLGLKTILSLADKERPESYKVFMEENGIKHIIVDMAGTKKVAIPLHTMKIILGIAMDRRNYPMLIHCNHGKHRTGCVVAIMRKVAGTLNLDVILGEYKRYAGDKIRDCDLEYIRAFNVLDVEDIMDNIRHSSTPKRGSPIVFITPLLSSKMGKLMFLVLVTLFVCWLHIMWFF